MRTYINDNWLFTDHFTESLILEAGSNEQMQSIRLPHTCKEVPLHYFDEKEYQMLSGYQRTLFAPEEWEGKILWLTFEGVGHDTTVYLNGQEIGTHHCGYTAFTIDISAYLKYGKNNLFTVRVDSRENLNIPPFGYVIDDMTFGGIYRDVYLDIKEQAHITDIFLSSNIISFSRHKAELYTKVSASKEATGLFIRQSMKNKKTGEWMVLGECSIGTGVLTLRFELSDIEFWDTDYPNLYEIKTELVQGGKPIDTCNNLFGFRKAEFKKDGFYLNDKKFKIRGLNRHQSYPYVGYAMPESMQRLDADILKKELGVNAVRTFHYPQSHYFLERCDELGLLVFTEIPGWQHIGNEEWKNQAVENVKDMVLQYRNHTSIILWGVRINESIDDDEFYARTNEMAHKLDETRQTDDVGALKKSHLQMYPTKNFDCEEHRKEHALRHVRVLDAVAGEKNIAGSFGWCMFDYNTHRDFGSGDHVCYHGVLDMFRNPKLAAAAYASQQKNTPVLELSSSMDIGEHQACNRGETYIFTNASKVRMYKNDRLLKEYTVNDSEYKNLAHGPIAITDYLGDALEEEHYPKKKAEGIKQILNAYTRYGGIANLPKKTLLKAVWLMIRYGMKMEDVVSLYTKYIGDWGGEPTTYRFEAVDSDGATIHKTIWKAPMTKVCLYAEADHTKLLEKNSYDVALVRIQAKDEYGNILPFFQEPVLVEAEGPITIIGPDVISLNGGMGGTYIKTLGRTGAAKLTLKNAQTESVEIVFEVNKEAY